MQYTKNKLMAQQLTLFHLGFYTGVIDGVWGPACIQAKREMERGEDFVPANPNGGLPFGDRDKLPKGLEYRDGQEIYPRDFTEEDREKIMTATQARQAARLKEATQETTAEEKIEAIRAEAREAERGETAVLQHVDESPSATEVATQEEPAETKQEETKQPVEEKADEEPKRTSDSAKHGRKHNRR